MSSLSTQFGCIKTFSSIFSVDSEISDKKFRCAIEMFGLQKYVDFKSVRDNYSKLLNNPRTLPGVLSNKLEKAKVVDVPGYGDCCPMSILTALLGFVPDAGDGEKIVVTFREGIGRFVLKNPEQYVGIFQDGMKGLKEWCKEVVVPKTWDGDELFAVFARLTGIVVHATQSEMDWERSVISHLPLDGTLTTSIVVRFTGGNHFQCVVPIQLPTTVSVSDKITKEDNPFTYDLSSDDGDWNKVKSRKRRKPIPRKSQRDRKAQDKIVRKQKTEEEREVFYRLFFY